MNTRTRCHHIGIHCPQDDARKRVTFCRERIIEDATGTALGHTPDQPGDLAVPFLPDLAATVRAVTDPVTGETHAVSGAFIAAWITAEYEARNTAAESQEPAP